MKIFLLILIDVWWADSRNTVWDYYSYPFCQWRFGNARRPAERRSAFPRTGDKRFGGWSC